MKTSAPTLVRTLCVLAGALLHLPTNVAAAANQTMATGHWQGTNACGNSGNRGVEMRLTQDASNNVQGVLDAYPLPTSTNQSPPASFKVSGVVGADGSLRLQPGEIIKKPSPNWRPATFAGKFTADGSQFVGALVECNAGGGFTLNKISDDPASPSLPVADARNDAGAQASANGAQGPASGAPDTKPPAKSSGGFFDSLAKGLRQGVATQKTIWAYADIDEIDGKKRVYCEMDAKGGEKFDDAVEGEIARYPNGTYGIKQRQSRSVSLIGHSCAKLEKLGKLVVTGYPSTGKAIDRLKLRNILPQYDDDQPIKDQFPHIAVTILKSPPTWARTEATPYVFGCWTLSMRIWDDAKTSRVIEPFEYCLPQDGSDEVQFGLGAKWPVRAKTDIPFLTGVKRTEGPQPPTTVIPNDRATADFAKDSKGLVSWPSLVSDREYWKTTIGVLLGTLRYQFGAGDGGGEDSHDLRVWIAEIRG